MSNVILNVPSVFVSMSQVPSVKAPQAAGARGLAPNLSLYRGDENKGGKKVRRSIIMRPMTHVHCKIGGFYSGHAS